MAGSIATVHPFFVHTLYLKPDFCKNMFLQQVRGPKGNRIYVSGPLLVPSQNVDQMLKEHDHRIQEFTRRARHGKKKHGKVHTQGFQQAMK